MFNFSAMLSSSHLKCVLQACFDLIVDPYTLVSMTCLTPMILVMDVLSQAVQARDSYSFKIPLLALDGLRSMCLHSILIEP